MPTGTPNREIRAQLLAAGERVLLRDGPSALTSRAVTDEARVAKGMLHRHFADVDTYVATLVVAQLERLDELGAALRGRAGESTVAANLAGVLAAALSPTALALVSVVESRRALGHRLRLTTPEGVPLLAETARAVGAYLTAERGLGRIATDVDVDVDAVALLLVGGARLVLADGAGDERLAELVISAVGPVRPVRPARPAGRPRA